MDLPVRYYTPCLEVSFDGSNLSALFMVRFRLVTTDLKDD